MLRGAMLGFYSSASDFTRRLTSVTANGKFSRVDAGPEEDWEEATEDLRGVVANIKSRCAGGSRNAHACVLDALVTPPRQIADVDHPLPFAPPALTCATSCAGTGCPPTGAASCRARPRSRV